MSVPDTDSVASSSTNDDAGGVVSKGASFRSPTSIVNVCVVVLAPSVTAISMLKLA